MSAINQRPNNLTTFIITQQQSIKQSQASTNPSIATLTQHLNDATKKLAYQLHKDLTQDFSGKEIELMSQLVIIFNETATTLEKLSAFQLMVRQSKNPGNLTFESKLDPKWKEQNKDLFAINSVPLTLIQAESFKQKDFSEAIYQIRLSLNSENITIGSISLAKYLNFRVQNCIYGMNRLATTKASGMDYFGASQIEQNGPTSNNRLENKRREQIISSSGKEQPEPKLRLFQTMKMSKAN